MSFVLFIAGLLGLVVLHARQISDALKETFEVNVFLNRTVEREQAMALKTSIEQRKEIKGIRFIDKDIAAKEQMAEMGDDFIKTLGYNPFGHHLVVQLKANEATESNLKALENILKQDTLVEDVLYARNDTGEDILLQITDNYKKVELALSILAGILLLIAITLINGTVRLNLFARRFLVKSMQYAGASDWFILKPFLGMYLGYGIISAILAAGMLAGIEYTFINNDPDTFKMLDIKIYAVLFIILLILAVVIVLTSAYFSTKKYLRLKIDQLY